MLPSRSCFPARKNPDFQAFVPTRTAAIRTNPWHTHQIHEWRRLGKILIFNIFPADPSLLSSERRQDTSCLSQTCVSLKLAQWHGEDSRSFYSLGLHGNSHCRWMSLSRGGIKQWGCLWNSLYGPPNFFISSRRKRK